MKRMLEAQEKYYATTALEEEAMEEDGEHDRGLEMHACTGGSG